MFCANFPHSRRGAGVCEYVCVCVCVSAYVYIFIYIYICICVYIYIYIYTHTYERDLRAGDCMCFVPTSLTLDAAQVRVRVSMCVFA